MTSSSDVKGSALYNYNRGMKTFLRLAPHVELGLRVLGPPGLGQRLPQVTSIIGV